MLYTALLITSNISMAQDLSFEQGRQAYQEKNNAQAYHYWEQAASQGNKIAQYNLGVMEMNIQGPSGSFETAAQWFRLAAAQGVAQADVELGLMHEIGMGVALDTTEALRHFRKAAKVGLDLAQFKLAEYYAQGEAVEKDTAMAVTEYKAAAMQGHAGAMNALGLLLESEQDYAQAIDWYTRAAAQDIAVLKKEKDKLFVDEYGMLNNQRGLGYFVDTSIDEAVYSAQYNLARLYEHGPKHIQNLSAARHWYRASAEQGYVVAQYNLAYLLHSGGGGAQDLAQAFSWFHKAAEQNYPNAQFNLALLYFYGEGTQKDIKKAIHWYERALANDVPAAANKLGLIYLNASGVRKNRRKAERYFRSAAERDVVPAQRNLAFLLHEDAHYEEALVWAKKAAEKQDMQAQRLLGIMYYYGQGIKQDKHESRRWLNTAADAGDVQAGSLIKKQDAERPSYR